MKSSIIPFIGLLFTFSMASSQTYFSAHSVWGGEVSFQYIDSVEFASILNSEQPKELTYPLKQITIEYYETSKGVLVGCFWGPSGLLFDSIDDFTWTKENRISLFPPSESQALYQTQLIWGEEDVKRFERELPSGFKMVGEDEYENYYRSPTGQIASIDKYGRSGMIYPSKEIYIYELKSMEDVPFLAIPMEKPYEED